MRCILPEDVKELRKAITTNGGFAKLRSMTAKERVDFFAKYADTPGSTSTAEWLNREIERRVLQPSQIQATKEWLQKLEKKKDVKITNKTALIDRITKKKEIFKGTGFYAEGMVKQVLGFETSQQDAKELYDLSVSINEHKKRLLALDPDYLNRKRAELKDLPENVKQARMELGKKLVEFQKKYEAINLKAQLVDYATKTWTGKRLEDVLSIAGNIKSLKASFDVSFLRQLESVALSGEKTSFLTAMKAGYQVFFTKKLGWSDTLMAELYTRPNALSGRYNQFGVEVGIKEEAFPESWLSKAIGDKELNLFRRSEEAFTTAIQTARADLFDAMWEYSNGDVKLLKDQKVGEAINILTGRGKIPYLTPNSPQEQRIINNLLFAPKWLASRIKTLTDIQYIKHIKENTPYGLRARAAVFNILLIAFMAGLRRVLNEWGVEQDTDIGTALDPRSSDFGKVIIGRTRFDLTTGTASLITLAARLTKQESMTAQGKVRPMKTHEILGNFLAGKSAPGLQLAQKVWHAIATGGEVVDYRGRKIEFKTEADYREFIADILLPISLTGGWVESVTALASGEQLDSAYWGEVIGLVADIVGIGANTYEKK